MNITTNDTHKLDSDNVVSSKSSAIYYSGVAGGAVVELKFKDEGGNFGSFPEAILTIGTVYRLDHGENIDVYAEVTGASGTTNIYLRKAGL